VAATVADGSQRGTLGNGDPRRVSLFCWTTTFAYLLVLTPLVVTARLEFTTSAWLEIGSWVAVVIAADFLRVRLWNELAFAMSLPVTLAAAMVLDPWLASVVAFAGSVDLREVRGEIPLARALFNRAQIGASILGASFVFHGLGVDVLSWPGVLPAAFAAFLVDLALNVLLVMGPVALINGSPPVEVARRMLGPSPLRSSSVFLCLAVIAPLMALLYELDGITAVVAMLAPLSLAWATYTQAQKLNDSTAELEAKNRAILEVTQRIADERRDERMVLAGELHDEVLPALYKVHLMGQVLRQDLEQGRLLELDQDLPELLEAADLAQTTIRGLLGDLRRSPLGREGAAYTIRMLAAQLEQTSDVRFELELAEVPGPILVQLLVYQVAREAMTNAARYSRGTEILVRLLVDEGHVRLIVTDDGVGFDPSIIDTSAHFGLQLMAERMDAVGGRLVVDSRLGRGTTVAAAIPFAE